MIRAINIFIMLAALMSASLPAAKTVRGNELQPLSTARQAQLLHQQDLAIIVNKSNVIDNLSLAELRQYFLADRSFWPSKQRVTVVMLKPNQPEREAVLRLFKMSNRGFIVHFELKKFNGEAQEKPMELDSTPSVIEYVRNVGGAIGYVRASEVDSTVKVVRVDRLLPGDGGYAIKL